LSTISASSALSFPISPFPVAVPSHSETSTGEGQTNTCLMLVRCFTQSQIRNV
jgi:hypothetical protein